MKEFVYNLKIGYSLLITIKAYVDVCSTNERNVSFIVFTHKNQRLLRFPKQTKKYEAFLLRKNYISKKCAFELTLLDDTKRSHYNEIIKYLI